MNERYLILLLALLLLLIVVSGCAQGSPGQQGSIGPVGPPGQDATPVTTIQFCPEQGSTTYGHFPEQGICINEKIIAAYWDGHNAFLAQVVPGTYTSTSTGLQCTFTVTSGCHIQGEVHE